MKKILLLTVMLCSALGVLAQTKTTGVVNLMTGMTAKLDLNNATSTATLTFTGPSDRWYALQFGSFPNGGGMQEGEDVVYYNGTTLVDAVHNGIGSAPSLDTNNWTVTSNTVAGTTRTIVATRAFSTGSADDYQFNYGDPNIDFAYARMNTASFSMGAHGSNRGYDLNNAFTCVAPAAPTASSQSFCSGATVANLTANTVAGATVSWYSVATGGTALAGTTALTTGNYYVSQTLGDCESTRTTVAVTVTTASVPAAPAAQSFCSGATVGNLAATASAGGTLSWYNVPTGGSALAPGTALTSGNYYVSQTIGACQSNRATVAVTISNPSAPTASAQTFCGGATVSGLTASGASGATFNWYNVATGGTALAGTTAVATGTYYVSQTTGTCESPRTAVAVTVNTVAAPTASAQSFCGSATVSGLTASGASGASFSWYTTPTGGTALASTAAVTTGTYYVSQTSGTCQSARTPVTVTVTVVAAPTAGTTQAFCTGATVAELAATGSSGATLGWYTTPTGGSALAGTTSLTSGNYYVSQTSGSCEGARTMVAVTVNAIPAAPTGDAIQQFTAGETVASLELSTQTGANITWYTVNLAGESTIISPDTMLVDNTVYFATQSFNNCESEMFAVTADEVLGSESFELGGLAVYPNPSKDMITITGSSVIKDIRILNMLGQQVLTQNAGTDTVIVDVSVLGAGTYILTVTAQTGEVAAKRIIKE